MSNKFSFPVRARNSGTRPYYGELFKDNRQGESATEDEKDGPENIKIEAYLNIVAPPFSR